MFNAHLKTKNQNLVATYSPKKDVTKIVLLSKDTDISEEELEDMNDEKLSRNSKIKEILPGLVIPYLSTEKGEVIINFK